MIRSGHGSWGPGVGRGRGEVPLYFPHCAVARVPAHTNLSSRASFLLSRPAQPLHFFTLTDFRLGLFFVFPLLFDCYVPRC